MWYAFPLARLVVVAFHLNLEFVTAEPAQDPTRAFKYSIGTAESA